MDFITDRTAADAAYWRTLRNKGYSAMTTAEKAEWDSGTLKGAYNVSDLNRVGGAVSIISSLLSFAGINVDVSPKTDWTEDDIPTESQLSAYLSDIAAIRAAIAVMPTTPELPEDMDGLTVSEANDIEQILLDVEYLLKNMFAVWLYSGEIYAGEV